MGKRTHKDDGDYHNLRCSRNNPQHVHVNQILNDINLDVFKSKNQYMIDAVEWYTKYLNEELPQKVLFSEESHGTKGITLADLEEVRKEIVSEVIQQVQKEIIFMLGAAIGGAKSNNPFPPLQETNPIQGQPKPAVNQKVAEMASFWGNDFE